MTTVILRLPAVMAKTGLSRSSIYALIQSGEFPKQIRLSRQTVGWDSASVDAWIQDKISASVLKEAS